MVNKFGQWIEEVVFTWQKNDRVGSPSGRVPWGKSIRISQSYFESLLEHAVPLDERAIDALSHSAMAMDIYFWLTYRLRRVNPNKPQFVAWSNLYDQFGCGYTRIRKFKEVFRKLMSQVLWQYPDARSRVTEEHNKGYWLRHATPPVPVQSQIS